jgi:hypothetical protein
MICSFYQLPMSGMGRFGSKRLEYAGARLRALTVKMRAFFSNESFMTFSRPRSCSKPNSSYSLKTFREPSVTWLSHTRAMMNTSLADS